jgi:hypothetical protein
MSKEPVFAFFFSPSAIPIHNDGNMPGKAVLIDLFQQIGHKKPPLNRGHKGIANFRIPVI